MIKVGLNGYGRIGRYFAELASKNSDIDLTINHLREDSRVRNNILTINGYEIPWITSPKDLKFSEIHWKGLDCIVEAAIVASREQLEQHLENARYVIMTGTPRIPVFTYNAGFPELFDGSQRIIGFGDDRAQIAGPLIRVLRDEYECRQFFVSTARPTYSATERKERVDSLGDNKRFAPDVEVCEVLHLDPNLESCRMTLVCRVDGDNEAEIIEKVHERFPQFKSQITIPEKRYTQKMSFSIEYDPIKPYTDLLYEFVRNHYITGA